MKIAVINMLRWLSLLPVLLITFIIGEYIFQFVLSILTEGTIGTDLENAHTNSVFFADFISGAFAIMMATSLIPKYKIIVSIILTIILITLIVYISFFPTILSIESNSSFRIVRVIAISFGAILGFLFMRKEIKEENLN